MFAEHLKVAKVERKALEAKSTAKATAQRPEGTARSIQKMAGELAGARNAGRHPSGAPVNVPGTAAWLSVSGFWTSDLISHHHLKVFSSFTEKSTMLKRCQDQGSRKVIVPV